ncbi:hypothetical protein DVH05_023859 [Phytophthora capsici]|nr:hypothetical protein DVH05_023859 [Phytophthora capsici]
MSSPGGAPPPAPVSLVPEKFSQAASNEFFVTVNLVGANLRCIVNPEWPCEALLGAAAESYHTTFPDTEVPECNVVFHRKKQEFLVAGTLISECCARGDELELGVTLPALTSAHADSTASIAASSVSGVDSDGEVSVFSVLFHKLPLGFTMKRGHDSSTEVGTIYPKSAATHFPRLTPGVTIMSIAGTPLEDMGLRQVHDLIKNAQLPLEIQFRGPELLASPSHSPNPAQREPVPPARLPASAVIPPQQPQQQGRRRRGSFDRRSVRSNGSNGSGRSRNSRSSGRGGRKKNDASSHHNQQKIEARLAVTLAPQINTAGQNITMRIIRLRLSL